MTTINQTIIDEMYRKIEEWGEEEFLQYLIRCCENIIEDKEIIETYGGYTPPMLQLYKMRSEITHRLANKKG